MLINKTINNFLPKVMFYTAFVDVDRDSIYSW